MLIDASVARSFAVIGWTRHLLRVTGSAIMVADGALVIWTALAGSPGHRTRDLLWRLVDNGIVKEVEARELYDLLRTDDLHNLGGPLW